MAKSAHNKGGHKMILIMLSQGFMEMRPISGQTSKLCFRSKVYRKMLFLKDLLKQLNSC